MKFTLKEWNLIKKALETEFYKVDAQLKDIRERNEDTRETLNKRIELAVLIEKLEYNEI